MERGIIRMAKKELLTTIRGRYEDASKRDKGRILDEFTAVTGLHRKHAIRLLTQSSDEREQQPSLAGRSVYDEAIREAVIVVWEASDRICGKRLHAALPHLVESKERHGHLHLDSLVRERLLTASASTLDRLLKPVRATAGSRRRRGRRKSMGRQMPVRPTTTGTNLHPATWRSTWWPTAGGHCPVPSSTAWWSPTSAPAGPRPSP